MKFPDLYLYSFFLTICVFTFEQFEFSGKFDADGGSLGICIFFWLIFVVVLKMCIFSRIVCITFETICILYADVGSPGIRLIRSAVMATVGGPVHFVHFDANF